MAPGTKQAGSTMLNPEAAQHRDLTSTRQRSIEKRTLSGHLIRTYSPAKCGTVLEVSDPPALATSSFSEDEASLQTT